MFSRGKRRWQHFIRGAFEIKKYVELFIYTYNYLFLTIYFNSSLWPTLQRKSHFCIPFLGIARPQSLFPHSCVRERFIYFQDRSTYFLQQNSKLGRGNIWIAHRRMNGKIWTVAAQFLFCKYLFRIFGIGSLQCSPFKLCRKISKHWDRRPSFSLFRMSEVRTKKDSIFPFSILFV